VAAPGNLLPIIGKTYRVYFKDPYDQVTILDGELGRTDTQSFLVFTVSGKLKILPTDRILAMEEL
jgi:hypothetical protein